MKKLEHFCGCVSLSHCLFRTKCNNQLSCRKMKLVLFNHVPVVAAVWKILVDGIKRSVSSSTQALMSKGFCFYNS